MKDKEYRKKIRQLKCRLMLEAGFHAGLIGVAAGLACLAGYLLYGRLRYQKLLLAEAGMWGVIFGVIVLLFCYCFYFHPRKKEVLKRIDALGLQERMITMEELKSEETVLARLQRQDTKEQLSKVKIRSMKLKLYIIPLLCSIGLAMLTAVLVFAPFSNNTQEEITDVNKQEMQLVDELVTVLQELVNRADITEAHKDGLREVIEALAVSFTPEDSTLTRTAKIATASRRLDLYEAEEQNKVNILKQQADTSDGARDEVKKARTEQIRLSQTVQDMKNLMGTLMDVLNLVEGSFWSPEVPSGSNFSEGEELPPEEMDDMEEPSEGEEPQEGEMPPEDMEGGEEGEPQEGMEGGAADIRNELIYDPEQGEVSYGIVFDEYYQTIIKALTEQEYSEEIRKMIEDYANSLE